MITTGEATLFVLPAKRRSHPARYTKALLTTFARMLDGAQRILDPFGGEGGVFLLENWLPGVQIEAIEIEDQWAVCHPRTTLGNALALPWEDGSFDAICTSPCLAHGQRILRGDLRWIPVEKIKEGDEVIAFDEFGDGLTQSGASRRRKWRIATVLRSATKDVECVRVHLANGESVICTPEHPWLAQRYSSGGNQLVGGYAQWVQTKDLITSEFYTRRIHGQWMEMPKKPTGWWVHKQLEVWEDDKSYESGWLAGMFDGEGSLAFGVHGSPKLMITQVEGEIIDLVQSRMAMLGIDFLVLNRTGVPEHRQQIVNVYVRGGFPSVLKTLGKIRPNRLLSKIRKLNIASRSLQAVEKVQVLAIESVGKRFVQEIETSTGTYIGEGYLHHNCYGNRLSDRRRPEGSKWKKGVTTYADMLGEDLQPDNLGSLPWGDAYREKHTLAWREAARVLLPGGRFVLNCKNHIRNGELQLVTEWHIECLSGLGFEMQEHVNVPCPGMRFGRNGQARVNTESVILLQKPVKDGE